MYKPIRVTRVGAFRMPVEIESHPHHDIPCLLTDGYNRWCWAIEPVLEKIQAASPDDYTYLCERIHHIDEVPECDQRMGTGAAFLPVIEEPPADCDDERTTPAGHGWLEFSSGPRPMDEHEYLVAHELAHGLDILRAGGFQVGIPQQQYEDRTDAILERWGFAMPEGLAPKSKQEAELRKLCYAKPVQPPDGAKTQHCPACDTTWWLVGKTACPACDQLFT